MSGVSYCCPERPDQVLFKEDLRANNNTFYMMIAERSATCPKCKKAYCK